MLGNFGDAEVFSFHATKFFNTFEGGVITTNDDALAERIRLASDFGFHSRDRVDCLGTNGKMSEIAAAMGLTNLQSMDGFIQVNRRNYQHYQRLLADIPGLSLIRFDQSERCNCQYVVVEVDVQQTGLDRDTLVEVLHAENILARRYFWPGCHRMEPYRTLFPYASEALPHTEAVADRILVLPTGSAVSGEDVETVCGILRVAIANTNEVHQRIADHG
jgi:dTDP-4-amino-4,6-dideoxygalactose transaminase